MATDASGFVPPPTPKRKKSYYVEEEEIVVKPSTELIPDEYEHSTNDNVLVHIFRTNYEEDLAQDVLKSLQEINYQIDAEKNLHYLNTKTEFEEDLETIKKETIDKSALMLVFIGFFEKAADHGTLLLMDEEEKYNKSLYIKNVWNHFTANRCPELKYKPKVFIFCSSPKPEYRLQSDSMPHRFMHFEKVYDFPAESDILIVYQKVDDMSSHNKEEFLNQLCYNVKTFSKKYDIVDLVSYIHDDSPKFVPVLVISTLTRKFYLTPSTERDHHLSIVENNSNLEESLKQIKADIQKIHDSQKRRKDWKMLGFSFKKKNEEKPKIKKREESVVEQPKRKETVTEEPKSLRASKASIGAVSSTKRLSGGVSAGVRTRQQSETDSGAGAKKKPIWKI